MVTDFSKKKTFPFEQGYGLLVDTNGVHRGVYPSSKHLRTSIQFEFSNKRKRWMKGYIGPVNYSIPKCIFNNWKKIEAIDPKVFFDTDKNVVQQKGRPLTEYEKITFDLISSKIK